MGRPLIVGGLVVAMLVLGACDSGGSGSATTTTRDHARASFEVRPVIGVAPPPSDGEAIGVAPGYNMLESAPQDGQASLRYGVGPVAMTGRDLRRARARRFPTMGWVVDLELAPSGVRAMDRLAQQLFSKSPPQNSIAIVVDGKVVSAPVFQQDSSPVTRSRWVTE